ncbi:hypothetical protein BCEP27_30833 [Burkholderia cepacia]
MSPLARRCLPSLKFGSLPCSRSAFRFSSSGTPGTISVTTAARGGGSTRLCEAEAPDAPALQTGLINAVADKIAAHATASLSGDFIGELLSLVSARKPGVCHRNNAWPEH